MAERERKQKPAPKEREEVVDEEVARTSERGEKLKEDIDDLFDEIDSVLEDNAEEFVSHTCRRAVSSYVQASVTVSPPSYGQASETCNVCGESKPLDDFYRATGMADGHRSECKPCNLATKKLVPHSIRKQTEIACAAGSSRTAERYRAKQRSYAETGKKQSRIARAI